MFERFQSSDRRSQLLRWEVDNLQHLLDAFEEPVNGGKRAATLGGTEEYLIIRNLPLPDGCEPDYVDALAIIDNYPSVPPIGLYVLNTPENKAVVEELAASFNIFRNKAFHDAPSLDGYTWICYHYSDNRWRFNANAPHKGDNIAKFIGNFYAQCEAKR